jgi:hypothetical protein
MIQSGTIIFNHLSSDVIASIAGQVNITNNSITSNKIADGTIITADLDDDSITSEKIKDGEVTIDDIGANAVGSSEIAADAVGSSEIDNGAVDTPQIASDAVTYDKMAIKIRSGVETYAVNGSIISHDLDEEPTSVIVTPIHDENINGGGYALYANVYDVTSSNFKITLWYQEEGTSTLEEVDGTNPWDEIEVYWIAIYTP